MTAFAVQNDYISVYKEHIPLFECFSLLYSNQLNRIKIILLSVELMRTRTEEDNTIIQVDGFHNEKRQKISHCLIDYTFLFRQ